MQKRPLITSAALSAALLILVTELVFYARTQPLTGIPVFQPTADDATVTAKRDMLTEAAGKIVLLGDSSCMMGLNPHALGAVPRQDAINLGTLILVSMPGFADAVDELLAQSPPPVAIVVAVLPRCLEISEPQVRDFTLFGRYLVAYQKSVPEYPLTAVDFWNWHFRKHRVNRFPPELGGSFETFRSKLIANGGHLPEQGVYSGPSKEFRDTFRPTNYSELGLKRLIDSANRKSVPVILWWSPSPSDAVSTKYLDAARQFGDRISAETGIFVPRPPPAWDPALFGTVTHVNLAGADRNSNELGKALVARLNNELLDK